MTKQRKIPEPQDEVKWEVGRRMRAVVDEGGNESQGCSAGPWWMAGWALSGISYRHTVNHSPCFFPALRAVWATTTKLKLWCFFLTLVEIFHVQWCAHSILWLLGPIGPVKIEICDFIWIPSPSPHQLMPLWCFWLGDHSSVKQRF